MVKGSVVFDDLAGRLSGEVVQKYLGV